MTDTGKHVADHRVGVVVPTRNNARTIEACLRSIREQTHPCTTVVVDNASTDATVELSKAQADIVISGGPERSAQRNIGARSLPDVPIVGFIDSDMVLAPEVVAQAVAAIDAGAVAVTVAERTVGDGYWVAVRSFERSFYERQEHVEAARFFRHDVFDLVGGFDEALTGPEDWDLTIRARAHGRIDRVTALIEHDEGHLSYLTACRKKAYYAEGLRRFIKKHGIAAAGRAIDRPYFRQPWQLFCRYGIGLIALKSGEALSVLLAPLPNRDQWRLRSRPRPSLRTNAPRLTDPTQATDP